MKRKQPKICTCTINTVIATLLYLFSRSAGLRLLRSPLPLPTLQLHCTLSSFSELFLQLISRGCRLPFCPPFGLVYRHASCGCRCLCAFRSRRELHLPLLIRGTSVFVAGHGCGGGGSGSAGSSRHGLALEAALTLFFGRSGGKTLRFLTESLAFPVGVGSGE